MKYGGRLVHRVIDAHGPIEVVEAHGVRSLHFGTSARQSAMDMTAPDHIELAYLRSMLIPLLFVSRPKNILLLGLGGGTLARFLLKHFPKSTIEAVELRPAVVDVAKTHFMLDVSPPLEVHIMDAHRYLETRLHKAFPLFDLALIDVFDAEGPSVVLDEPEFLLRVSQVLAPQGAMALNLWSGEDASWRRIQSEVQRIFKGQLAALPVPGRGNRITLALGESYGRLNFKALTGEAKRLERELGVEFVRLFERLEFTGPR